MRQNGVNCMKKNSLIWIFLLALLIRLITFWFLYSHYGVRPGLFWADSNEYTSIGRNLALGNGFSEQLEPPFINDGLRTPGYPLFIALFYKLFGNLWSISLAQACLNALVPVITFFLAQRISKNLKVAYWAAILVAIEPHLVLYSVSLSTEGIFVLIFLLTVLFFTRWLERQKLADLLLSGVLLSLGALTRPILAYCIPLFVGLLAFYAFKTKTRKKATLSVLIFSVISVSLLLPWMYRNYRLTGQVALSNIGWVNMYTRLAATLDAASTGQPLTTSYVRLITQLKIEGYIQNAHESELYNPKFIPLLKERSLKIILAHPVQLLALQPLSLHTLFTSDNLLYTLNTLQLLPRPVRPPIPPTMLLLQVGPLETAKRIFPYLHGVYLVPYVMRGIWYAVFIFALIGTYRVFHSGTATQKKMAGIYGLLIGSLALLTLPISASLDARYRVPFEPLYFIFVALGLIRPAQKISPSSPTCLLCSGQDTVSISPSSINTSTDTLTYRITESSVGKHFELFRCLMCKCVFQPFPGGSSALLQAYADQPCDTLYLSEAAGRRICFQAILQRIEKYVPKGTLLDVGAGVGLFLNEARQRGWSIAGVELSQAAVNTAESQFNIHLIQGDITRLADYPDASFDVVTAFDVAEHLESPTLLFREAHRLLRPHGLFIWTTPNYDSLARRLLRSKWYNILPFHLVYFTKRSIRYVEMQYGFRLKRLRSMQRYFSIRYLLYRLFPKFGDKLLHACPRSKLLMLPIPVQLYDEFEIYFEKS